MYDKKCPSGVSSDSLVDGGEEGGLFPLQKLLKFFRIKFHSEKLSSATGTTKKSLWGCLGIFTQSMGIGAG